jgi:hypothetical protein
MHYVKLAVGVAAGLALYKYVIEAQVKTGNEYGDLGVQALSVVVGLVVVGMVL